MGEQTVSAHAVSSDPGLTVTRPGTADELYSWTIVTARGNSQRPPQLGAVGVSDIHSKAVNELQRALRKAPTTAFGLLHRVHPSFTPKGVTYHYERVLAVARWDRRHRTVLVEERNPADPPGPGGGDVFTEITRFAAKDASGQAAVAGGPR